LSALGWLALLHIKPSNPSLTNLLRPIENRSLPGSLSALGWLALLHIKPSNPSLTNLLRPIENRSLPG
ncbi:hypothetical protein V5H41_29900, partial [Salmonella enterica]